MKASTALSDHLQAVLVDLIALHLQGKQAHWNIVGKNFRDLHLQLDEIVVDVRLFADEIAERMRALQAVPDGRGPTVVKAASLSPLPAGELNTKEAVGLITERLEATVATMRRVHDDVEAEDPTTADLLHTMIARLEQLAWMVSAENGKPAAAESGKAAHSGKRGSGKK